MSYLAKEYCISRGVGKSKNGLPSFDRALLDAGVGNYNLVRLSSILPANCKRISVSDITTHIEEGSLLPTAYSTISSDVIGDTIVSTIGVGIPKDKNHVGVIMEYSAKNVSRTEAVETLLSMIQEGFEVRGWELEDIIYESVDAVVEEPDTKYTTFACISEW